MTEVCASNMYRVENGGRDKLTIDRIRTGSKLLVLWDDGLDVVKVGIRDFIVKDEVGFDKFIGHGQKIG